MCWSFIRRKVKNRILPLNGGNLEFSFKYDIASIFNHFGMLDATGLAKKIGMNPSLLRQYNPGIRWLRINKTKD